MIPWPLVSMAARLAHIVGLQVNVRATVGRRGADRLYVTRPGTLSRAALTGNGSGRPARLALPRRLGPSGPLLKRG